jgi:bla regulator protein BlaR1
MAHEPMIVLLRLTLAASAAILAALLLRRPLRRLCGAGAAYLCWLMVPAGLLAAALPALRVAPSLVLTLAPSLSPSRLVPPMPAPGAMPWAEVALLVWLAGACASGLVLLAGQRRFVRSLGALKERDGVLVCAHARHGPALLGLWRPVIVVPADFAQRYSMEEQALIIAHERQHAERRDPLANAALALLQCAFWFHPLIHIAAPRFRFDQELACDADVLVRTGGRRQAYASAMLKTGSAGTPSLATCHWQSNHPLKERIMQLKHTSTPSRRRAGHVIVALLACAGLAGTFAARAESAAANSSNSYMVAFKFTANGQTTAPSVLVAAGEPFAVSSSSNDKGWKGDFLITEDAAGVWLKSQFTIDGKKGGIHNGAMRPGVPGQVTIMSDDRRALIVMEATLSRVAKKPAGT